jgi:hypothetical protein
VSDGSRFPKDGHNNSVPWHDHGAASAAWSSTLKSLQCCWSLAAQGLTLTAQETQHRKSAATRNSSTPRVTPCAFTRELGTGSLSTKTLSPLETFTRGAPGGCGAVSTAPVLACAREQLRGRQLQRQLRFSQPGARLSSTQTTHTYIVANQVSAASRTGDAVKLSYTIRRRYSTRSKRCACVCVCACSGRRRTLGTQWLRSLGTFLYSWLLQRL